MTSLYSSEHRALQEKFGTTKLAAFLDTALVHGALTGDERAFIEGRDMFFLSSVDPDGNPTVSYKGGPTGFVKVLDERTLVFPGYDGNGMFLSLGNIEGQGKVGLLFIDFSRPNRMRVQGVARLVTDHPLMEEFAGAEYLVFVDVTKIWPNCSRYIHRFEEVEQSAFVPRPGEQAPLASWKRLDLVQETLPAHERQRAEAEGLLDLEGYGAKVAGGQG